MTSPCCGEPPYGLVALVAVLAVVVYALVWIRLLRGHAAAASAAALAVLEVIEQERVLENVHARGEELAQRLGEFAQRHARLVAGTRGRGLLQALVLNDEVDALVAESAENSSLGPFWLAKTRMYLWRRDRAGAAALLDKLPTDMDPGVRQTTTTTLGIVASAEETAAFLVALMRGELVDPAMVDELWPLVIIGALCIPLGLAVFRAGERYAKQHGKLKRSG